MADEKIEGENIDTGKIEAIFRALRAHADKSIYGKFITDAECRQVAIEIVVALEDYNSGKEI
jgi:hypothetical protein